MCLAEDPGDCSGVGLGILLEELPVGGIDGAKGHRRHLIAFGEGWASCYKGMLLRPESRQFASRKVIDRAEKSLRCKNIEPFHLWHAHC